MPHRFAHFENRWALFVSLRSEMSPAPSERVVGVRNKRSSLARLSAKGEKTH